MVNSHMEIQKVDHVPNPDAVEQVPHYPSHHQTEGNAVHSTITKDSIPENSQHQHDDDGENSEPAIAVLHDAPCRPRIPHVV